MGVTWRQTLGDGSSPPGLWPGASGDPRILALLVPLCEGFVLTQVENIPGREPPAFVASRGSPGVFRTSKKSPVGVRPD